MSFYNPPPWLEEAVAQLRAAPSSERRRVIGELTARLKEFEGEFEDLRPALADLWDADEDELRDEEEPCPICGVGAGQSCEPGCPNARQPDRNS